MKIGDIFPRLFFCVVGAICGVGAYFTCPLVGEVALSFVSWTAFVILVCCCGVMVWYGLFLNRAEEFKSEKSYREGLKELDKTPLRKRIDGWAYAAFLFALGGFMLYTGVDNLLEGKWLGFILYAVLGAVVVVFGVELLKISPEKEEEEARQFRMKCMAEPADKSTLLLVRNAKSERAVKKALRECVPAWCEEHTVNAVQLWQMDAHGYAATFPCGVDEEGLIGVLCGLSNVGEVRAWVKTTVLKELKGEWAMVVMDASDELVAVTDKGTHHITYVADDGSIRWKTYHKSALAFKSSPGMPLLKGAKRLDVYF